MYQSGRAGDEAKKPKSRAKSERVGITAKETNLDVAQPFLPLRDRVKTQTNKKYSNF